MRVTSAAVRPRDTNRRVRSGLVTAMAVAAVWLALAAQALGAGKPVSVGTPLSDGAPSVAVDSAGNAVIAWANTKDLNGATNFVQWCVVPAGGSACTHSGILQPADNAQFIDNVQAIDDGSTIVILADVFGAAGSSAEDYIPEQEWQSTDGGATFTLLNGGLSVSSGILNADTVPVNAVVVPGTGVLGYGWDTASGPPTFNAFPLNSPPECSRKVCATGFATLQPASNPDTLSNEPGHFAAQTGASAGVMGAFDTLFTNGPLGCPQSFGTAFVYGSGNQSASNDYNISPGSANCAWRTPVTHVDCNTEYSTVGGGPSGFGIFEDNLGTSTAVYHRFDQANGTFDTPLVTVAPHSELDPALSQDGAGGVYATYLSGGDGGPVELSYSGDGGHTFVSGPVNPDHDGGAHDVTSTVNATGQGWAAWNDNGSVIAQPFMASDAISAPAVASGADSNGKTITVNVSCASFPCTISVVLSAPETVVVHASAARRTRHRTKTVTIGRARFTLTSASRRKLAVSLNGAGKHLVATAGKHLKVNGVFSARIERHTTVTRRTLTVTVSRRRK